MWKITIYIGIGILMLALAGLWLKDYSELPDEPDKVLLKDGTIIQGKIVKQEFGKYVVLERIDSKRQVFVWEQVRDIDMFNPPWYLRVDEALDGILKVGVIGGFIVFGVGLWQYSQAQKWKRAEFLTKEIDRFEDDHDVANARTMLDFNGRDIFFYAPADEKSDAGDDSATNEDSVYVDHALLVRALRSPEETNEFDEDEQVIRDTFDVYLSNLERFNNYLQAGLVKKKELKIFLEYWLRILGDPTNRKISQEVRQRLWDYMLENDFRGALQLLRRYGYKIKPSRSENTANKVESGQGSNSPVSDPKNSKVESDYSTANFKNKENQDNNTPQMDEPRI